VIAAKSVINSGALLSRRFAREADRHNLDNAAFISEQRSVERFEQEFQRIWNQAR